MLKQTVIEYNETILDGLRNGQTLRPSAVLCIKCHTEMLQHILPKIFNSYPPKMEVSCPGCNHIDYKII